MFGLLGPLPGFTAPTTVLVEADSAQPVISGELKKWHKITLTFDGPEVSETNETNPFMRYRFNVRFTHDESGRSFVVPGFFVADGKLGVHKTIESFKLSEFDDIQSDNSLSYDKIAK